MGNGAGIDANEPCLPSIKDVHSSHLRDRYSSALLRHEEFLERESRICKISGYHSAAPYAKPLMADKLERSLACLDDIGQSYSEDQHHRHGNAEATLAALSSGGAVRTMCVLGDTATVACAADNGPMWIYNWREGAVVSRMRERSSDDQHTTDGHTEGRVMRMCTVCEDHSLLVSGDAHGYVQLWDLTGPSMAYEARLHERAVTGLQCEFERQRLISTAEDAYIMIFDLQQQSVVERAVPASVSCGHGVPNTALTLGGVIHPKMLFVGGRDGKLRLWTKDDGPLRRQCTVSCGKAAPTQCLPLSSGYHMVVSTVPADQAFTIGEPGPGGLMLLDLRKMGGSEESAAGMVIASYDAGSDVLGPPDPYLFKESHPPGAIDMALREDEGEVVALCLMDGALRAFSLGQGANPIAPKFDFDIVAKHDRKAVPCGIAATDDIVFTATTRPSLAVWRWPDKSAQYGHDDYKHTEPQPPLLLRWRCAPLPIHDESDHIPVYGNSMAHVKAALAYDVSRLHGGPPQPEPRGCSRGPAQGQGVTP